MPIDGLILSADNIHKSRTVQVRQVLKFDGFIVIDSGGFRMLSKNTTFDPQEVIEWQKRAGDVDVLVVLDYPIEDGLSINEVRTRIEASINNVAMWLDEFGPDKVMPVLHGRTRSAINFAKDLLFEKYGRVFKYIGIGSIAEVAKRNLPRMVDLARYIRKLLPNFHLHAFGCGGSSASILAAIGFDSADCSSHLVNSKYGLVMDPDTLHMCIITPLKKEERRPKITADELFARCNCPVCKARNYKISTWGKEGFILRAIHNAWNLSYMVKRKLVNPRWKKLLDYI